MALAHAVAYPPSPCTPSPCALGRDRLATTRTGRLPIVDLQLTEEQTALRQMAADFVDREVVPHAAEWDRRESVDTDIVPRLGKLGLLGVTIGESYGGAGGDHLTYCLMLEELGRGDSSIRGIVSVSLGLVSKTIATFGTEEQKREWLPQLCSGQALGCFGLTEPDTGSDAAALRCRAERDGGDWVITGSKMFITNGTWAKVALVMARSGGPGPKGITAFLVPTDTEGFSAREIHGKLGLRGQATAELIMDGARVPDSCRLGDEGQGFTVAMSALAKGRMSLAAGCVGICAGCLRVSVEYAKTRQQFGRPIAGFQLVQDLIASMALDADAARLLVWRPAVRHRGVDGEAIRQRGVGAGRQRRGAGVRRLRLHRRVPGREVPARRAGDHGVRGHHPDPEAAHRAGADRRERLLMTAATFPVRAAVLRSLGGELAIEDVELYEPGPGQVRVRMAAVGVCHSDLSLANGTLRPPRLPVVLGHEGAGTVAAVGDGVTDLAVGDPVVLNWAPACRRCWFCQHGEPYLCAHAMDGAARVYGTLADGAALYPGLSSAAFATETVVGRAGCIPLPPDVPLEQAALLGCAVLTGVGAVLNAAGVRPGETVLVVGLGGVGLSAVQGALADAGRAVAGEHSAWVGVAS